MADKYLSQNATNPDSVKEVELIITSAGAGDSGKGIGLDANGLIALNMMPANVGPLTDEVEASETLAAGDWVNLHASTGNKVRKADATTEGKECDGFVLAGITSAATGTVYFHGINNQVTGLTPGDKYFLDTTAGAEVAVGSIPAASGNVQQSIGKALSATELLFQRGTPLVLA